MKLNELWVKWVEVTEGQTNPLDDYFFDRVQDYRPDSKKQVDILDRIGSLREQIPDEVFLELDEAYVDLMTTTNADLYKKGFMECLQMVLSAASDAPLLERKGEEH